MERKTRNYTEEGVVNDLKRKHDLRVVGKKILQLESSSSKGDVGNKTKGKIDFLVKYCNYIHYFVDDFQK